MQLVDSAEFFRINVTAALNEKGWSITELAEAIGSSRPGVSRIIHGHDGVTIERADRIAKALGKQLSHLLDPPAEILKKIS